MRPDDRSWPSNAHPPNQGQSREHVLVHNVTTDECPCPAEAGTAVDGHSSPALDFSVAQTDELLDELLFWAGTVGIVEVVHSDPLALEDRGRVEGLVKPYHTSDAHLIELFNEVLRGEALGSLLCRGGESEDLPWHDPIHVSFVESVVKLVVLVVESLEVVPA